MTTFDSFKRQVYRAVQDDPDQPFRYDDAIVAEAATEVYREFSRNLGKSTSRVILSLVSGQREYTLPPESGRVTAVWVKQSDLDTSPRMTLEVDSIMIPPTDDVKGNPVRHALNLKVEEGSVSVIFDPVPENTISQAIIVEVEASVEITSSTVNMPIPPHFSRAFVYLCAAYLLLDTDDETSMNKAQTYRALGKELLFKAGNMGSVYRQRSYGNRIMP